MNNSTVRFSLNRAVNQSLKLIRDFPVSQFALPGRQERWRENPQSIPGRICNDILFQLKILPEEKRRIRLKDMFTSLCPDGNNLALAAKDQMFRDPAFSFYEEELNWQSDNDFLWFLRIICHQLHLDCLRRLAEKESNDWDRPARELKKFSRIQLQQIKEIWPDLSFPVLPPFLSDFSQQAAEEEFFFHAIEYHIKKAASYGQDLEQYSLIIEKIRPPMGVVTHTSPALLRPCSYILMDGRIDASSGIPYNAALILSILQDSRCIQICLNALKKWPPRHTKIRENLIYTLGLLKADEAVSHLIDSLKHADQHVDSQAGGSGHTVLLREQKEEAIQALGRIGEASLKALPEMCRYAGHPSMILQTTLAWALGEMGKAQKNRYGGVGADILITMLKLLQSKNKQVFEETVAALKKIDMPEFIHSLYLYNVGAVNILGLKPAQRGLYELSETLHYLIRTQGQAVIAVNGDSGTGKTYFCHALLEGFADISSREILYLMRDRTQDQKIFNRMLGIKWLRKYIEPSYYQGYPYSEEEDDPEFFLQQFFSGHSDKKLIILDGCRDRHYFQRVIDLFYFRGKLDCEINFRATQSTRRRNLEEREIALESVKNHLAFLEEPALEDTHFYREGFLILYDLDNSIGSRLKREEIHELFGKSRIETWGDLIRLGDFTDQGSTLSASIQPLSLKQERAGTRTEAFPDTHIQTFSASERKFTARLNPNLADDPHLLLSVDMDDLKPQSIRFYALQQIAGTGARGDVFVLSFIDNRIFHFQPAQIKDHAPILLGRDLFFIEGNGQIQRISFERGENEKFRSVHSPVCSGSVYLRDMIVTGHADGTVAVWNFAKKQLSIHPGHTGSVRSVVSDHYGNIYSWGEDGLLIRRHPEQPVQQVFPQETERTLRLQMIPWDRLLVCPTGPYLPPSLKIIDFQQNTMQHIFLKENRPLRQTAVDQQARIITALGYEAEETSGTLAVVDPNQNPSRCHVLNGHPRETLDCLVMGPQILTCGRDDRRRCSLCVWGTPFFVQREHAKLSISPT
jgi:hypothetical protein